MAVGLLTYSGIVTKTKAMKKKLLTEQDYVEIVDFKIVSDFISYLKESNPYGEIYKSHEEIKHRGQVETMIRNSLYADYAKLYRFANAQQRQAMKLIFFRFEINLLKDCLKGVFQEKKFSDLSYLDMFFHQHAAFSGVDLAKANSLEEFLQCLKGTRYEAVFVRFQKNGCVYYRDFATQLDVYYYICVWKQKEQMHIGKSKKIVTHMLGTQIDWLNIMWIYRSKKYYNSDPKSIYPSLIPIQYKLTKQEIKSFVEASDTMQMCAFLKKSKYFHRKDMVLRMEEEWTYQKIMERVYEKNTKSYPMSIAIIYDYFYKKEVEIERLTMIMEGIRYQLSPSEILDLILLK